MNIAYYKDLVNLFSQYYNVLGAKKIDDLTLQNKNQIAITLLKEESSPFDAAELLLLPSDQNKDTIISILEARWFNIIDDEETVRRIFKKVLESKKSELDEVFSELVRYEKLESSETNKSDREYELYCHYRSIL